MPAETEHKDRLARYLAAGVPLDSVLRAIGDAGEKTSNAVLEQFGVRRAADLKQEQRGRFIEECYRRIAARKSSTKSA
jgi:hypothetical protein